MNSEGSRSPRGSVPGASGIPSDAPGLEVIEEPWERQKVDTLSQLRKRSDRLRSGMIAVQKGEVQSVSLGMKRLFLTGQWNTRIRICM